MGASTTAKLSRVEQCRKNAQQKSEQKRRAAFEALSALQKEKRPITKTAIARRAGVSVVFLRNHADLLQAINDAERVQSATLLAASPRDKAKDQIIAALRRRLDALKQELASKDVELRQKQREIDRLYGKLAANSSLTDPELRCVLTDALQRLTHGEGPVIRSPNGPGPHTGGN
jgi:hypothetical protein